MSRESESIFACRLPLWLLRFPFRSAMIVSDRTKYRVTRSFRSCFAQANSRSLVILRIASFESARFIAPIYARFSLLPIMRCPRLRRYGYPIVARKSAQSGLYREIASFYTTRDIRANLPLNAALRAVLTFNMFFVGFICIYAVVRRAGPERKRKISSVIIFAK